MRRLIPLAFVVSALWTAATAWAQQPDSGQDALQVGLLPYLSTHRLIERYLPLKRHLEEVLQRKVVLTTAPSFRAHVERAAKGRYDVYFTAPHFAALAERRYGHRRVARLARELDGSVIVIKGGIDSVVELKGKVVTTPDKLAIVTFLAEDLLRQYGLELGDNVTVLHMASHNDAILALSRGKSQAAVVSAAVAEKMPPHIRDDLRTLTTTRQVPHAMFMAANHLPPGLLQRLREAMLSFQDTAPGQAFFQATGYQGMKPIEDQDMEQLVPYVETLEQRLAQ